ncbi:MAG: hypothetical protein EHM42_12955 [Planctomycetaceae bacterium]|nr:MAG: hypothetical protein EHM42_12955 [Planctomycetaceae bacterium]
MVALDTRFCRPSPFSATIRSLDAGYSSDSALPAVVETASPRGGVVRLPGNNFRQGDRFVLSVQAAQYNLLDVVAEIVDLEPSAEGGCRAGVEFHPELERRHYVLVRRVTDRAIRDTAAISEQN